MLTPKHTFDIRRLSEAERQAHLARISRDGHADVANLFLTIVSRVSALKEEGLEPEEILHQIVGAYGDLDHLVMLGPTISHQTMTLAKAMVRQAMELVAPSVPHVESETHSWQ
jgi:hypothetical protein